MIYYDGRNISSVPSELLALLRDDAQKSMAQPRGDVGDESPLDWVNRLIREHTEYLVPVEEAYAALLGERNSRVVRVVLEQVAQHPRSFSHQLADAIARHHLGLQGMEDGNRTDGRTMLGTAVHTLSNMINRAALSDDAVSVLAAIDRREDGWPLSFLLALPWDLYGLLPKLNHTLELLNDDELPAFAQTMVAMGPPLTEQAFETVARASSDLRERFADAVRTFVAETASARAQLLESAALDHYPPEVRAKLKADSGKDPWPGYAARLGVDP